MVRAVLNLPSLGAVMQVLLVLDVAGKSSSLVHNLSVISGRCLYDLA